LIAWLLVAVLAPRTAHAESAPGPTGTDAIGSDEAPLPAAPPPPGGRLTRGPFTGRGWFELGATVLHGRGLPHGRRLTSAGLSGAFGIRPHRNFGVFTAVSTWIGDIQEVEGVDDDGNTVVVATPAPMTAWEILGVRGFLPLRRRIEPSLDLATGMVVERRPFTGRRVWGAARASAALAVWVAPTLGLRFAFDYRLHARTAALRHFIGGSAMLSIHF
jgi:hypothetical protein